MKKNIGTTTIRTYIKPIQFKRKNLYKCTFETQLYAVQQNVTNIRYIKKLDQIANIISKIPEAYKYLTPKQHTQELELIFKML